MAIVVPFWQPISSQNEQGIPAAGYLSISAAPQHSGQGIPRVSSSHSVCSLNSSDTQYTESMSADSQPSEEANLGNQCCLTSSPDGSCTPRRRQRCWTSSPCGRDEDPQGFIVVKNTFLDVQMPSAAEAVRRRRKSCA